MAKLKFKDFLAVDYAPGEDDLIKKNAKKRKGATTGGTNAEYSSTHAPRAESVEEVDEALTMAQRRKKSIQMKKFQSRLAVGRKRQAAKVADTGRLKKRAQKAARAAIAKKLTKGIPKSELTPARKQEIEKRLDKMTAKISALAKKMLPKIRKAELAKKRNNSSSDK
jgi:hypothetical protein